MIYTVFKGLHYSFPRKMKIHKNIVSITWKVKMLDPHSNKTEYLKKAWNKVCGLNFKKKWWHFFSTKNSARIGCRWNEELNKYEFCAYYHLNSKIHTASDSRFTEPLDKEFIVRLIIDWEAGLYSWSIGPTEKLLVHLDTQRFNHDCKYSTESHPHFGGKIRATNKWRVWLKRINLIK